MAKRKGLGSGLEELFRLTDVDDESSVDEKVLEVKIDDLRPNPYQPRKVFDSEALNELKMSIKENGILQPIVIRKTSVKGYEIVAGERRYRAAKALGLKVIPAVARQFDDQQMMELALLENLQREDLSAIEEAEGYRNIMAKAKYTQEEMADKMGKSRSHVANLLRLLTLPEDVKDLLSKGKLELGHAKVLLGIKNPAELSRVARIAVQDSLSVRQLEVSIKQTKPAARQKKEKLQDGIREEELFIKESTETLREKFGTKVAIEYKGGKGKIEFDFMSVSDFERLIGLLNK